jgi:uncharacterized protein (DUF1015 family)
MAEILPFIGTRYNSQLIGNLSKVLSPPYDAISEEQQAELYNVHPNNVVRLELSRDQGSDEDFSNRYTRAANCFRTWRSDGILIEDENPAFYLYEQEFQLPGGETKRRRGFFALVKLEDSKCGKRSEDQLSGPRADRLKLLRETHANFSPAFLVYSDKDHNVMNCLEEKMKDRPWEQAEDEDHVIHKLWVVQKKEFIVKLRELLKAREVYIADGHQRYETALAFRDEMRDETGKRDGKQPFDYMMMYLTSAEQDGLVAFPTHRTLSREFVKNEVRLDSALEELEDNFDIKEEKVDLNKPDCPRILQKLEKIGSDGRAAFAMITAAGKIYYLHLKKGVKPEQLLEDCEICNELKQLDVSVLHYYIINDVFVGNPEFELEDEDCCYIRDAARVFDLLKSKKSLLAFIMNPIPVERIMKLVSTGICMTHKPAFFHPKIITGLVLRNMEIESKKAKSARR